MGINKVQYGNTTLIDLTADTVTPSTLLEGYTAHDRSGALIIGTATGGGGTGGVTQDQDGYIVLDDQPGASVTVEPLSVTQNGTYTAPTGKAYSPVSVSVSGGGGLEYEEGTYTTAEAVTSADISFSNAHTNVPFFVGFVDATGDYNSTLDTAYAWWYFDWYELYGKGIYYNSTSQYYAYRNYRYRASSATSITGSTSGITSHPDTTNLTNTYFHASFGGAYLRPNRTYKWIAVWKPTT